MIVRIVKNWHFPNILRQTPQSKGVWNNVTFTTEEIPECDLLVVLNSPPNDIKIKCMEKGKWLFSQESPIPMYEWHQKAFPYFDRVYTFWENEHNNNIFHEQTSLPWHINRSYDELKALEVKHCTEKKDHISWITSNASHKEGHKLRMGFKDYLMQRGVAFDLWGRGFTPIEDKFDGIFPYKYSLGIENYACEHYWTEKIADCYLSWTMPIYYGCQNIQEYFPIESMILIDLNKPKEAVEKIMEAVENNYWEKNIEAIAEARSLVLEKYQLFPNIVSKLDAMDLNAIRKYFFIPANTDPKLPVKKKKNTFFSKIKKRIKAIFYV